MRTELEILRKRITELEYLKSKHEESEKSLKHALRQAYDEMEKQTEECTVPLIIANRQLQQEISDHIRMEYALYYRAEFEKLIATLSTNFIRLSQDKIHCRIKNALQRIGKFIGVDRSYMFLFTDNRKRIGEICEWHTKGVKPQIQNLKGYRVDKEFPWLAKKIKKRGVFYMACCESLPPKANAEKEYFQAHGIQSIVTVPMFYSRSLIGCLGFDSVREKKTWTVDIIVLLRIVGEIFANCLVSNWKEDTFRKYGKNIKHISNIFQTKRNLKMGFRHN